MRFFLILGIFGDGVACLKIYGFIERKISIQDGNVLKKLQNYIQC